MARIKVDLQHFPVEDTRTREELQAAEYNLQCLLCMAEEYNEELRAANAKLHDDLKAFPQAQGYEADPLGQAGQADTWADVGRVREQDEEIPF